MQNYIVAGYTARLCSLAPEKESRCSLNMNIIFELAQRFHAYVGGYTAKIAVGVMI